jgi:hypothetical protein
MLELLIEGMYEMASFGIIYPPIFMKISRDFQATLRSCFRKLTSCNTGIFGIIGGKDLCSTALNWPQVT